MNNLINQELTNKAKEVYADYTKQMAHFDEWFLEYFYEIFDADEMIYHPHHPIPKDLDSVRIRHIKTHVSDKYRDDTDALRRVTSMFNNDCDVMVSNGNLVIWDDALINVHDKLFGAQ